MKPVRVLVVLLTLALLVEDVGAWFVRRSARRKKPSCSWMCGFLGLPGCRTCRRRRVHDVDPTENLDLENLEDVVSDIENVLDTLDMNGDGFVELHEIAHVTGLKVNNPVLLKKFHKADENRDGKLNMHELGDINFDTEYLKQTQEQTQFLGA